MTYKIRGDKVTLILNAEEVNEVIAAIELTKPGTELLEAWYKFRQEEFA